MLQLTHSLPAWSSTFARMKLKGIDGARTSGGAQGLIRSKRQEPLPGLDIDLKAQRWRDKLEKTGGAWLSSARVVRCWVKSRNERNPCCQLPALLGTLARLPVMPEEGGDDVKSSCPL